MGHLKITGGVYSMISFMPSDPRLAFAYVPFQKYENIYSIEKSLKRGTIFKDLDIPFDCYRNNPIMNPFMEKPCKK